MKIEAKKQAITLREQGMSLNDIVSKLKVSKSSVSLWVRDIELSAEQKNNLTSKGQNVSIVERRRQQRLKNENAKRQIVVDEAKKQIKKITDKELWLIGTMLYWAEGGKTQRALVRFSNGDPEMIKIMMEYFKRVCKVSDDKFRGYIHIHPHLDIDEAENYWSKISGIPKSNFFKTYNKKNISSKNTRNSLPHGTFDIYICSTELFLKIQGWVQGIFLSY